MHTLQEFLKDLIQRMTVREKLLSFLFLAVLLGIWAGNWGNRIGSWNDTSKSTYAGLEEQNLWLERADTYAQSAQTAMERLDSQKTFNAAQLSGRVDSLLRTAGLSSLADIDSVKSSQGEIFNEHTVRVQLKRISIGQLVQFNKLLRDESPYINQLTVRINADRRNRKLLDVRFEIASLELNSQSI